MRHTVFNRRQMGWIRLLLAGLLALVPGICIAEDWPTYMHDNTRAGVSSETVGGPLLEQWVYRSPSPPTPVWPVPQPGWTELPKLKFDDAFYVVADAGTLYFGSSVDHSVSAMDAATGALRWKFFTGGPVRLAPTLAHGKVYFGSDDGVAYCVNQSDGTLVWSFDAAGGTARVLAGGKASSLSAIRTNILVEGDRAFLGAGVFPYHQTSAIALDATSGKLIWRNPKVDVFGGFSPQGYLLATRAGIIFPAGRSEPVCLSRDNGSLVFNVPPVANFKGGPTGVYGVVFNNLFFCGTQNTLFTFNETGRQIGRVDRALKILPTVESVYVLAGPPAPAYGRRSPSTNDNSISAVTRAKPTPPASQQGTTTQPATTAPAPKVLPRWTYKRAGLTSMIAAGDSLFAGDESGVVQLDAQSGKEKWNAKVDSAAVGLAFSNGRLFVSTVNGSIYCFATTPAPAKPAAIETSVPPTNPQFPLAQAILRGAGTQRGYALIIGPGAVDFACALATQSELQVTCFEPVAANLHAIRSRVDALGLYGKVAVESGDAAAIPFPDFAANLVVKLPGDSSVPDSELFRALKPCGGVLFAAGSRADDKWNGVGKVTNGLSFTAVPGAEWVKVVRGELPGSGWWTHQYGDAGNTGSSGDKQLKGRLGVLWYGEPGGDEAPDRHQRGSSPLMINGRVFMQGWQFLGKKSTVICFDAYNGVRYWETPVPNAVRLGLPGVSGNLACDAGSVFVAAGANCFRLDAVTGEIKAKYELPEVVAETGASPSSRPGGRSWGFVSVVDGLLLGSTNAGLSGFSNAIFAIDVATGKQAWVQQVREVRDTTLVVGQGRLFYAENRYAPPATAPGPVKPKPAPAVTTAPAEGATNANEDPKRQASAKKAAKEVDAASGDADEHDGPDDADDEEETDRLGQMAKKESTTRSVMALDIRTGAAVWERQVDLAHCGRWWPGTFNTMQALCNGDVLVFAAANTPYGGVKPTTPPAAAVALSTKDGTTLWSNLVGNRSRPIFMQGALLAEPNFVDLKTGAPVIRTFGLSGRSAPWKTSSRAGCGSLSASESMIFGRHGSTLWQNVAGPGGSAAFVGTRPGCLINIIPAGGVAVQVEASSGCACYQAVQCTVVFRPVPMPPATQKKK